MTGASEARAVKDAARRIVTLFYDDNGQDPFRNKKFCWVSQATLRPQDRKADYIELAEVFNDIADDLHSDELNQYARENNTQQYFQKAWKGPERFREIQQYFDPEEGYPYNSEKIDGDVGGWGNLIPIIKEKNNEEINPAMESAQSLKEPLSNSVSYIKKSLCEFESCMKDYQGALQHRLEGIRAVQSCVGLLSELKGLSIAPSSDPAIGTTEGFLTDNIDDVKRYYEKMRDEKKIPIIDDTFLETHLTDFIKKYLADRGLDSPILLDHVHTAALTAFNETMNFDP
ncbi:MAG: hypothetical protein KGJ21_00735, partial [Pseudomonadota bacterium]|nr:hypothetical protein [Pseudomonadota bacterium]